MRLSDAQCIMIENAHSNNGRFSTEYVSHASVYRRQSAIGLVRAGLAEHLGTSPGGDEEFYRLTDAGRTAYATNGRIRRTTRCNNPVCCGTWPADNPQAPPSHGSCRVCGRWIKAGKTGLVGRHTDWPGQQCPGAGRPRVGLDETPAVPAEEGVLCQRSA